ncbi:hypothetical protein RJT34_18495 [Clitoria ternatea]|uniref:Uncharacterized protein n=1 Tax=Clitoria ternatea TaxID=43366 RepID=A0AAN9JAX2_CLITE
MRKGECFDFSEDEYCVSGFCYCCWKLKICSWAKHHEREKPEEEEEEEEEESHLRVDRKHSVKVTSEISVAFQKLSLISNPQFAESHFDLAASPTNRHPLWSRADIYSFVSIDKDASPDDDSAIVTLLAPYPSCTVLGSCRGFLLLHHEIADFDLIIWNPSTGAYKSIPRPVQCDFDVTGAFLCGFGYDLQQMTTW